MIKRIYISAWVLLGTATLAAVFSGSLNPVALLIFSLVVLALVLSFGLWTVFVQTQRTSE